MKRRASQQAADIRQCHRRRPHHLVDSGALNRQTQHYLLYHHHQLPLSLLQARVGSILRRQRTTRCKVALRMYLEARKTTLIRQRNHLLLHRRRRRAIRQCHRRRRNHLGLQQQRRMKRRASQQAVDILQCLQRRLNHLVNSGELQRQHPHQKCEQLLSLLQARVGSILRRQRTTRCKVALRMYLEARKTTLIRQRNHLLLHRRRRRAIRQCHRRRRNHLGLQQQRRMKQ